MALKRILATTDFSQRSDRALRRAAFLSSALSADLQLLHVVDDDQPIEVVEQEARQAAALLEKAANGLREAFGGAPVTSIKQGDPFQEIVRAAVDAEADLIAMGSHRKRLVRDVFVGTTIERVMRTGRHPVLMVNTELSGPYRRIIVATDMSEASAHALRTAKSLGLLDGAHVSLLHAFEPFAKGMLIYANVERENVEKYVDHEASETRRSMTEFLSNLDFTGLRYDVRLEEGGAFFTIKKIVDKEKPDLLVIGTRGLTGVKRVLLGSVADAVMRGVNCDILAVPLAMSEEA
ncbi:MAG TPA: universal stress protein [Alphaproteobacteria bacterium]|nr:universal stress protein [Alphaproteobacteria bacterium]